LQGLGLIFYTRPENRPNIDHSGIVFRQLFRVLWSGHIPPQRHILSMGLDYVSSVLLFCLVFNESEVSGVSKG
jgi:hypothetical protein